MDDYEKAQNEIVKKLNGLVGKWNVYSLWRDFLVIAACTISNRIDKKQYEYREKMYMETIKKYSKEEANVFAEMIALTSIGLSGGRMGDFLGEVYMQLEIGNKDIGQFFSPYSVSQLSAEMVFNEKTTDIVTLNEPSCGSGGMIIAYAEAMKKQGINYQQYLRVVCNDLDYDVVKMAYIQLSLLGIDAVVMQGDTLTQEMNEVWRTPMHYINLQRDQDRKELKNNNDNARRMLGIIRKLESQNIDAKPIKRKEPGQSTIFDFI